VNGGSSLFGQSTTQQETAMINATYNPVTNRVDIILSVPGTPPVGSATKAHVIMSIDRKQAEHLMFKISAELREGDNVWDADVDEDTPDEYNRIIEGDVDLPTRPEITD